MRLYDYTDVAAYKFATIASSALSGSAAIATADWTMGVFGVPLSVFLAGFAGAMVSLSFLPAPENDQDRSKTLRGMAWHVAGGTILAAYLQPLATWVINFVLKTEIPAAMSLPVACALGAVLMLVIPIGLDWLKKRSTRPA